MAAADLSAALSLKGIEDGDSAAFLAQIRPLFTDYAHSLNIDLDFQGFNAELASLPGAYWPPGGALLLATVGGAPAGCGAYRPLPVSEHGGDHGSASHLRPCEMKRLYVRPAYRGLGLGRLLAAELVARARKQGYATMLLDTLQEMSAARALYADLGFVDTPAYCYNPINSACFLKLDLTGNKPES